MPVINTHKDLQSLTLTFVCEFDTSVERLWQVWQDPRQLERWWGPPTWPATFERHDFVVGGQARYFMTGPEGEKARGWWTITAIDAPHRLEFDDGFAGDDGEPLADGESSHSVITIEAVGPIARMTIVSTFANSEQMEQLMAMGMAEGSRQALGQIDSLLTEESR